MNKKILISLLAPFMLNICYAKTEEQAPSKQQVLTYEQLVESCSNPARFHNQIAPTEIKIRCQDMRTVWAPFQQKAFEMKGRRGVRTSIISDKYVVNDQTGEVPLQSTQGLCQQYQELNQGVVIEKKVTCEELLNHKGEVADFCLEALNKSLIENKDIMSEKATGRIYSACKGQIMETNAANLDLGMNLQ